MNATHLSSPGRVAGIVLAALMLGHVLLVAPPASADCVLSAQDKRYVALLQHRQIGATSGNTDCDVAGLGRQIADNVRVADNPPLMASTLADAVYDRTNLTAEQAAFEVAAAIYVYAPEMVWVVDNTAL